MNKEIKRLDLNTPDGAQLNMDALYQIAPSVFTESRDEKTGELKRVVNFDALRQLLGDNAVDENRETYEFRWVGKDAAKAEAARAIDKTLRPVVEDSVDWDTTKNLYIEGDNLEVLKLLQRSYMGKVKMIYIDPPYNTGNDFVYHDDFAMSSDEYEEASEAVDDFGNKYFKNTETSGRFHSDWCNMIYPRLMVARSLLSEDGVIFISIDLSEEDNLKKICNEIFGDCNFRNTLLVRRRIKSLNSQFASNGLYSMNIAYEYVLVYARSDKFLMKALRQKKENASKTGRWDVFWSNADRPTMRYEILGFTPLTGQWRNSKDKADIAVGNYKTYMEDYSENYTIEEYSEMTGITDFIRRIPNGTGKNGGVQHWVAPSDTALRTSNWTDIEVSQIAKEIKLPFDNPKSKSLLIELCNLIFEKDSIILDFFSGSATTAHAVMQLNAEDGGNRKFIMVQLPEETAEDSEAFKAGFKNICEIGKERIRRAGKKIKEESPLTTQDLDTGFRVLRLDDSNFNPGVKASPSEYNQQQLDLFADNIKPDRTDLDLLFGSILAWGLQLDMPMETEEVDGCKIYTVNDGDLVACFAEKVTDKVIEAMAEKEPLRVLFRDSCFDSDDKKINLFETFKQKLDWTDDEAFNNIRVI